MSSGKALFAAALSGETGPRPAFLLHANPGCASFSKGDPAAFRKDPESVRATLAELQQICGADAITAVYDPRLEDEAFLSLGAAADLDLADVEDFDLASHAALAISFDATNRLVRTTGQVAAAICGVLSGPVAAARVLGPERLQEMLAGGQGADVIDAFSAPLTTVLRRLCELGVDAVVLREDLAPQGSLEDHLDDVAFAYRMMNAVARHYKVPLIFAVNGRSSASLASLEIDRVSLPLDMASAELKLAVHQRIPDTWLSVQDAQAEEHQRALAQLDPSGRVIEAEWFGEGRVAIERLMRLGRVCGSLSERG